MTSGNTILIMGRPNVGKSTLINRLVGNRAAITADKAGVTRDIAHYDISYDTTALTLVDSGGVLFQRKKPGSSDLQDDIEARVKAALTTASVVFFIADYKAGVHPDDYTIATYLKRCVSAPVFLLVNKLDDSKHHHYYTEFYKLGFDNLFPLSAAHGTGLSDVMRAAIGHIKTRPVKSTENIPYTVSLVGRPNVGKSSLINTIVNDDRVLVSKLAGTTRDAITIPFKYQNIDYRLIDTAGMRKQSKLTTDIDYYASVRAADSIKQSDCVVLVLEADPFLTDHDKKLINLLSETAKALIIFVNKWDLVERSDATRRSVEKHAKRTMPIIVYYPMIFGSATLAHNHHKLLSDIPKLVDRSRARIKTAAVNAFMRDIVQATPPHSKTGQTLRIFYATQAESSPPTVIIFVNNKNLVTIAYHRFLERKWREKFDLFGVPLRLFFKNRSKLMY